MKFGIRELVFLVVMLGLLGASYFLVFTKADAKRAARQAQIDEKTKALADLEKATASVHDVDRKIAELQQATSFFESKLPQENEIDKVLKEVWQLAETNNLQTKSVKTLKAQRMTGYSEQPIEMSPRRRLWRVLPVPAPARAAPAVDPRQPDEPQQDHGEGRRDAGEDHAEHLLRARHRGRHRRASVQP